MDDSHVGYKQNNSKEMKGPKNLPTFHHIKKQVFLVGMVRMRNFSATFACMHKQEIMKTKN